MRAALICLAAGGDVLLPPMAGRSVAQAQLDFALRCGCDMVVVHGHGGGAQAIELRHRAESAGARFQSITNAQALIGLIGADDALLVLQPGLWTDCAAAEGHLRGDPIILVMSAGAGVQAGFERIDLDRSWAGALTVSGAALQKLSALPEDIAPAPAILRIALQHRLAETRLPAGLLDDGSWSLLRSADDVAALEERWIRRVVGEHSDGEPSRQIAAQLLHRRGGLLAANRRVVPLLLLAFVVLVGGAVASGWFGMTVASFALLALAGPLLELLQGTVRLCAAPKPPGRTWAILAPIRDAALAACAWLAIGGLWYRAAFVALVLVAALALLDRRKLHRRMLGLRDRGLVALVVALACLLVPFELAILLVSGMLLIANLAPDERDIG